MILKNFQWSMECQWYRKWQKSLGIPYCDVTISKIASCVSCPVWKQFHCFKCRSAHCVARSILCGWGLTNPCDAQSTELGSPVSAEKADKSAWSSHDNPCNPNEVASSLRKTASWTNVDAHTKKAKIKRAIHYTEVQCTEGHTKLVSPSLVENSKQPEQENLEKERLGL